MKEQIINGVLMCRPTPRSKWMPASIETVTQRLIEARAEVLEIEKEAYEEGREAGERIPSRMYR